MRRSRSSHLTASVFSVEPGGEGERQKGWPGQGDLGGRGGLLRSPEDMAWWETTFVRCPSAIQPQHGPGPDVEVEKAPSQTNAGSRISWAEVAER